MFVVVAVFPVVVIVVVSFVMLSRNLFADLLYCRQQDGCPRCTPFVGNCHQYARFWHAATTYAAHFWHSLKVCALFNSYIFYTESSTHGIFAKVLTIL